MPPGRRMREWRLRITISRTRISQLCGRRTEACKGSAQVPKNRGLGIASLAFDRKLGLHVELTHPSTKSADKSAGEEEYGRYKNNYAKLHQHLQRQFGDGAEPSR